MDISHPKQDVRDFWNRQSCGEVYAEGEGLRERLETQARARYKLEPYLFDFAKFHEARGLDVLEVGVGMGADHLELAKAEPRSLSGVDLTPRGIEFTHSRLEAYRLKSDLRVGDAESLPFPDDSFDLVYSYGVLHHSPDTQAAVNEVWRVLRPGGTARVMIYHYHSLVGYMLWLRYGLAAGKPGRSLADIYAHHLESPGTKAFTVEEVRKMFGRFSSVDERVQLAFGDLLEGAVGQRHGGVLLRAAKALWPRAIIKRLLPSHGLCLMIEAVK